MESIEHITHRDHWLLRRIRSVPGNSTAPFIISPMMHPTDQEDRNRTANKQKHFTTQALEQWSDLLLTGLTVL